MKPFMTYLVQRSKTDRPMKKIYGLEELYHNLTESSLGLFIMYRYVNIVTFKPLRRYSPITIVVLTYLYVLWLNPR